MDVVEEEGADIARSSYWGFGRYSDLLRAAPSAAQLDVRVGCHQPIDTSRDPKAGESRPRCVFVVGRFSARRGLTRRLPVECDCPHVAPAMAMEPCLHTAVGCHVASAMAMELCLHTAVGCQSGSPPLAAGPRFLPGTALRAWVGSRDMWAVAPIQGPPLPWWVPVCRQALMEAGSGGSGDSVRWGRCVAELIKRASVLCKASCRDAYREVAGRLVPVGSRPPRTIRQRVNEQPRVCLSVCHGGLLLEAKARAARRRSLCLAWGARPPFDQRLLRQAAPCGHAIARSQ
jgi:Cell morphogenesis central region